MLDKYIVEEEAKSFEAWKAGKELESDPIMQAWIDDLEMIRMVGVKTLRLHVVSLPLTDYIKYRIEQYGKTKESVSFISREDYIAMQKPFEPKEFWLIDQRHLFLVNYDKDGKYSSMEEVKDYSQIARYTVIKRFLLEKALPVDKFFEKNKERL